MEIRYVGFDQRQNFRVFRFAVRTGGRLTKQVSVTADMGVFRNHNVGIQEGPFLSGNKLTADLERGWEGEHESPLMCAPTPMPKLCGRIGTMPVVSMDQCPDRLTLSGAVAEAIRLTYKAKADLDAAREQEIPDTDPFILALAVARSHERNSQRSLREHIEAHRCSR